MKINDSELKSLTQRYHFLIRQEDKLKEFQVEEKEKLKEEIEEVKIMQKKMILDIISKQKEINNIKEIERDKMEKEIKPVKKIMNIGRKPQKDSLATHIETALLKEDLCNINAIVDFVNNIKPGDISKIKRQTKAIIYKI